MELINTLIISCNDTPLPQFMAICYQLVDLINMHGGHRSERG